MLILFINNNIKNCYQKFYVYICIYINFLKLKLNQKYQYYDIIIL